MDKKVIVKTKKGSFRRSALQWAQWLALFLIAIYIITNCISLLSNGRWGGMPLLTILMLAGFTFGYAISFFISRALVGKGVLTVYEDGVQGVAQRKHGLFLSRPQDVTLSFDEILYARTTFTDDAFIFKCSDGREFRCHALNKYEMCEEINRRSAMSEDGEPEDARRCDSDNQ